MHRAEQPSHEQLRSFDPLASVDMMRFDLQHFGAVLPETRQRVYDEELSYIAEGIDRASRTSFTLRRDESGQLVYFNDGQWVPYSSMLHTGLRVAENEARADYRKQFLADWAARDWQIGMQMQGLSPGETMSWHNSYPQEVEAQYGQAFLQEQGLKPHRKMGFLYQARCHEDGSVSLYTQTVDRSNEAAFNRVTDMLDYDPDADMDTMLRTYDGALREQYGGTFYAGRREAEVTENAWNEIIQHKDLIEYYLQGIERLATIATDRTTLETMSKRHTYGVWAALRKRLDRATTHDASAPGMQLEAAVLMTEVKQAYSWAAARSDVLIGCGGAMRSGAQTTLDTLPGKDAFNNIFGEESSGFNKESSYKFDKLMFCVVCQAPPSEIEQKAKSKKLCGPCGICKGCDTKIRAKNRGSVALAA